MRGGHCHYSYPAKTTFAAQVRQRTGRGPTSAAHPKTVACLRCAGAGARTDALCGPCLGTGRITLEEVS